MSPTTQIILLWLGYGGSHVALSSLPVRRRLVGQLGEWPFRALYSLVAFAFFIPLVGTYFDHKHSGAVLWSLPHDAALEAVLYAGMGLAWVLAVGGFVRPSPGFIVPGDPTPRGALRITRHPLMMALVLFGLLHLLPNGSTADVAFFGGLAAFALIGAAHQDRRKLATVPGFREFYEATSFFPFGAPNCLQGLRELLPAAAAIGIVLTVVVRHFHATWFGG